MNAASPILRVDGLFKSYGGIRALDGVTFELSRGVIAAIIGPNGAGKTTLLNVITGFVRPDVGRVMLASEEISCLQPHEIARKGVARTFQELRIIPSVPVLENVMLARLFQPGESITRAILRHRFAKDENANREAALHWLRFVELEVPSDMPAGLLSYGQQKLLTLACCLATEAHTLLLDEPVSGVHPEMVIKILSLLQQLRSNGRLIVFIEHDIAAVRRVADYIIVMGHGKNVAEGPPNLILDRPEIMDAYIG